MQARIHPDRQAGLTLIEVTLVVAVLLGLIGTGLVGVGAYKQGANRALCVQNIARAQKAMRAYCHFQELVPGQEAPGLKAKIVNEAGFFAGAPECPAGGTYRFIDGAVPEIGTLFMNCSIPDHVPASLAGW